MTGIVIDWQQVSRAGKKKNEHFPEHLEENILYFIEKNSLLLETWRREIIRIVCKPEQYFYPRKQTGA